jgi:O-antigen/teichoic acid export membrane protein
MAEAISRKGIADYLTITGGVLGRLVVSLVYFLIVANALTLADFGVFAAASAVGLVLSRLLAFGFISPVYRAATVKRRVLGAYCAGLSVAGLISLPLIAAAAYGAHSLFFAASLPLSVFLVIITAEVIGWRIVEYVAIINNGLNRFATSAGVVIGGSTLRTLAALGFLMLGEHSLESWALWYLGATMLSALIAVVGFVPRMRLRFRPALYPRRMRDALAAAGSEIIFYAQSELDKLLVLILAGPQAAGLYAIAMRVIDLTAIPVRSFNQLLVQALMRSRQAMTVGRRVLIEGAIAIISTGGLVAIIVLLALFPTALGRNVAAAGALFPLMLAVPAFRNLVEYHAELLYAAEKTGLRMLQLGLVALLKALLMILFIRFAPPIETWSIWLNLVFAALYGISLALILRWLPPQRPAASKPFEQERGDVALGERGNDHHNVLAR